MEEKCLKCGGVLFKKGLLDDKGHMGMDVESAIDLESDGVDQFFKCPHCKAKNVVILGTSPRGLTQVRISHIKEGGG